MPSFVLIFLLISSFWDNLEAFIPTKTYECSAGACHLQDPLAGQLNGTSQAICLMSCGKGMLWPYPTGKVVLTNSIAHFSLDSLKISATAKYGDSQAFQSLWERMDHNFRGEITILQPTKVQSSPGVLRVDVFVNDGSSTQPGPENDDSYTLQTERSDATVIVRITSNTIFGARHGLETLSQLIAWDEQTGTLAVVTPAVIVDEPVFKYRGIMIDVARNFISLPKLRENLRALGYNKLNTLHLHLSDSASFPFTSQTTPNLTIYGAYDEARTYSTASLQELVEEAASWGVQVIPEIDAPAHMAAGWQFGPAAGLGDLVLCADPTGVHGGQWMTDSLEPPSGQLNLINPEAMRILGGIYEDVAKTFGYPTHFHLGGDEVIVGTDDSFACYNSTKLAQPMLQYLEKQGLSRQDPQTFYSLWVNFTLQATASVQATYSSRPLKLHLWGGGGSSSSVYNLLTLPDLPSFLPPDLFVLQIWDEMADSIVPQLIRQGYEVILSNTDYVYLDCGNAGPFFAGGYWCQPYHEWYHIYEYIHDATKKWALTAAEKKRVLGAETLIWTEMVDDVSVSQKLWPRSAALAEALWSDPQEGWYAASERLLQWRRRLVSRGVQAEALQPLWCEQHEGSACTMPLGTPQ